MIIRQKLVPSTIAAKVTSGKGNLRKKICIHETGNSKATANANAHATLQANGNSRQASWHWTVDDKEAVQSFDHSYKCWAAGTGKGNNEAIHIEICVNNDGNYKKAVQNAAELVAKILKEEKLTINDVVQHNHYSGKNCPQIMRSGNVITWSSFLQMVKGNTEMKEVAPVVKVDNSKPDKWAEDSWKWAEEQGYLDGTNPKKELTRQEFAVVLKRLHDKLSK